jgi:hypothetical protein
MRFITALRAFGCPSCQLALHCVWVPLLPNRLALPLVRLLVHFVTSFRAFGCPSCELAFPCVQAPNLGVVVLKNLPPSQNCLLSVIWLVFFPSAPFCGRFCCDSSCVSLRSFVHLVTAIHVFGHPSCQLALHCVWVPLLPTRLALPLVPNLGQAPHVFRYGSSYIWAPMFRTRLALRSGAHIVNSPCVALRSGGRVFNTASPRLGARTQGKASSQYGRPNAMQGKGSWKEGHLNAMQGQLARWAPKRMKSHKKTHERP